MKMNDIYDALTLSSQVHASHIDNGANMQTVVFIIHHALQNMNKHISKLKLSEKQHHIQFIIFQFKVFFIVNITKQIAGNLGMFMNKVNGHCTFFYETY